MAFVKLDCGMLDSTLWTDRTARELFITALLMAQPHELEQPLPAISVQTLTETGFVVPPGWYGFVPAAGTGIVHRAGIDRDSGMAALERLGEPEGESRTPDFEGRRMVRVSGGYIILNFDKYRSKDHTAAERAKRYRDRKSRVTNATSRVTSRNVTQAEAEAEALEKIYAAYPKHVGKPVALKSIGCALKKTGIGPDQLLALTNRYAASVSGSDPRFIPHPSTWFNQQRFNDDPKTWEKNGTHRNSTTESNRNLGTANEGRSSQYAGVGKVR